MLPFTALYWLLLPFIAFYILLLRFTNCPLPALYCPLLLSTALYCPLAAFYCPLLEISETLARKHTFKCNKYLSEPWPCLAGFGPIWGIDRLSIWLSFHI